MRYEYVVDAGYAADGRPTLREAKALARAGARDEHDTLVVIRKHEGETAADDVFEPVYVARWNRETERVETSSDPAEARRAYREISPRSSLSFEGLISSLMGR